MYTPSNGKVKRIAIVGPECTGKTDLSMALAEHYETVWVPEYARGYIGRLDRPYQQADLYTIAQWQLFTEDELALKANMLLICDTDLTVIKVWSEFKYGNCDAKILSMMKSRRYDLHLLTGIDIPWENDPQREHPDKREYFYNLYKNELLAQGITPVEISGDRQTRKALAIAAIDALANPNRLTT
ncbi:MAG: ATP-binding protein [Cyclobacteriaceae bacterium]|nr:ATP-binding protein [Cyclobacteriaceae bacterium]UYN86701.1 MAG: ATP-binding protein [Cyclobacteriaceae bacterium]